MKTILFAVFFMVVSVLPVEAGFRSRRNNAQTIIQINQGPQRVQSNHCNNGVLQSRGFGNRQQSTTIRIRQGR